VKLLRTKQKSCDISDIHIILVEVGWSHVSAAGLCELWSREMTGCVVWF